VRRPPRCPRLGSRLPACLHSVSDCTACLPATAWQPQLAALLGGPTGGSSQAECAGRTACVAGRWLRHC
jgi:hypothetical protein